MFKSAKSATYLLKQTLVLFLLVQLFVKGQETFTMTPFLHGLYWKYGLTTPLFGSVSVTLSVVKYVWLFVKLYLKDLIKHPPPLKVETAFSDHF